MFRKQISFTVNGEIVEIGGAQAFSPLSDTLRYHLRKTGTKVVCAEGDCGACTVMMARCQDGNFRAVNSCIYPTFSVDGCHLVTVEGLQDQNGLHEIQNSMVRNFGGQCGFCTPGFVMAIANLYENKSKPTEKNVKNYLTGNLCRCTGYQPIVQAALDVDEKKLKSISEMYPLKAETEFLKQKIQDPVHIEFEGKEFFGPITLQQVVEFKNTHPEAQISSGATDLGVQINKGKNLARKRISLHLLSGLDQIDNRPDSVHIGARVTLNQLQYSAHIAPAFANFLNIFASPQIKNAATLVGNLANGSPIGDTTPFLLAVGAQIDLIGPRGQRQLPVEEFFKGYKCFAMDVDEWITGIWWRKSELNDARIGLYKVSQRRDLDISCVNACFLFRTDKGNILNAKIAYGGVGPIPIRLTTVENYLAGQKIEEAWSSKTADLIANCIQPISDARGASQFRIRMAQQLLQKFRQEHYSS